MSLKIITTRDGSRSLFSEQFQQHYHNISGALTESRNVFFDNTGLSKALAEHRNFTLCEVGFGTGLHVALLESMRKRTGSRSQVHYYSVEKYPLEGRIVRRMDFGRICEGMDEFAGQIADALYSAKDGESVVKTIEHDSQKSLENIPYTRIEVFRGDFHDWHLSIINQPARFILHDAFSPHANPELWTTQTFRKLLSVADSEAMLGTYCSATKARAAMILAGWHVARVEGPPGKREVTLASPSEKALAGYKRVNEDQLTERFREELS